MPSNYWQIWCVRWPRLTTSDGQGDGMEAYKPSVCIFSSQKQTQINLWMLANQFAIHCQCDLIMMSLYLMHCFGMLLKWECSSTTYVWMQFLNSFCFLPLFSLSLFSFSVAACVSDSFSGSSNLSSRFFVTMIMLLLFPELMRRKHIHPSAHCNVIEDEERSRLQLAYLAFYLKWKRMQLFQ